MKVGVKPTRIWVLFGIVICVVLVLVVKLYIVQIVHGEELSEKADRQYVRPHARLFDRGAISFETKDGSLIDAATLQTGYTLAINPSIITEPADIYNNLSFVLRDIIDEETFFFRATKPDDPYEEIARRVSRKDADAIEALQLTGVSLYKDRWRFYPGKQLAAHAIGFMSWRGEEYLGQYGLERFYEETLRRNSKNVYANLFIEIFSGISNVLSGQEKEGSIVTTLEPTVQDYVEQTVDALRKEWQSDIAGAIVMDPNTGAIRAMTLSPSFDLNLFNEVDDVSLYNNALVESVYEMGSTVKPLTLAIGLDKDVITAQTTFDDKGSATFNNRTIFNYDKKVRGIVTMQDALNNSLNTGMAFVMQKVGKDSFRTYMKKLLGSQTGIDLPNEAYPLVSNLDSTREIEHVTASYGQGVALSPIAMTRALAALGNGGYLVQPHIVSKIIYENGTTKDVSPKNKEQVFKEETSEEISRMLATVVEDALLGGTVALPHHSVAAKTGTAQMANEHGSYLEDQYLHSFFGYFPAFEPEFIVFLYHVDPRGAQYASETLTHSFMDITKFLINYYEIPPDK